MNIVQAEKRIKENIETKTTKLDLSGCKLLGTENFLRLLERCDHLIEIDFSGNRIKYEKPGIFGSFAFRPKFFLESLHSLPNLKKLDFSNNKLSDVTFLHGLTVLKELDLRFNKLNDISCLKELKSLDTLCLRDNKITDVSSLKSLTSLKSLDLSSNKVLDVSSLSHLKGLKILDLSGNKITDASLLGGLLELSEVCFTGNKIRDFSFLNSMINLEVLTLRDNGITDISFLGKLNKLKNLDLQFNQIYDFAFLDGHSNLQVLKLGYNQISEIGVNNLPALEELRLEHNKITEISAVQNFRSLQYLDFSNNEIEDISSLAILDKLQVLNGSHNKISLIPDLAGIIDLSYLNLSNNRITEINFLLTCVSLSRLELKQNPLSDLSRHLLRLGKIAGRWGNDREEISENDIGNLPLPSIIKAVEANGIEGVQTYFNQLLKGGFMNFFLANVFFLGDDSGQKSEFISKLNKINKLPEKSKANSPFKWSFSKTDSTTSTYYTCNILNIGGAGNPKSESWEKALLDTFIPTFILLHDANIHDSSISFASMLGACLQHGYKCHIFLVYNHDTGLESLNESLQPYKHLFKNKIQIFDCQEEYVFKRIQDTVEDNLSLLSEFSLPLPNSWLRLKDKLEEVAQDTPYLSYLELLEIGKEIGLDETKEVVTAIRFFHSLGQIFYFEEDELLKEHVVIDPGWVFQAVQRLLNNSNTVKGFIEQALFIEIWQGLPNLDNKGFGIEKLVRLLFRLSYTYRVPGEKNWVVPLKLTKYAPHEADEFVCNQKTLFFEYEFDNHMPKGLIPQLILFLYQHIPNHRKAWFFGFNIVLEDAVAEIKEESIFTGHKHNKIVFRANGRSQQSQLALLAVFRDALENKILKHITCVNCFKRQLICHCNACKSKSPFEKHLYQIDELMRRIQNGKNQIECGKSFEIVSVKALLDNVGLNDNRFVEVIHSSRQLRKELESVVL